MEEKIPVDGAMGRYQDIGFLSILFFNIRGLLAISITVLLFLWF
jgi:hypothetical protein